MRWPFQKTEKIKCPDGTIRIVYKDLDDAFPLVAKDWVRTRGVTVRILEELKGSLSSHSQNLISGFLFDLDDANKSMQLEFRKVYATYQGEPCNSHEWLKQEVEEIIREERKLRRIQLIFCGIKSLIDHGADPQLLNELITEVLAEFRKPEAEKEISNAFLEAGRDVSRWMEVV